MFEYRRAESSQLVKYVSVESVRENYGEVKCFSKLIYNIHRSWRSTYLQQEPRQDGPASFRHRFQDSVWGRDALRAYWRSQGHKLPHRARLFSKEQPVARAAAIARLRRSVVSTSTRYGDRNPYKCFYWSRLPAVESEGKVVN